MLVVAMFGVMLIAAHADGLFAERKAMCLQCHGANGVSPTPEVPSLGGMPEFYALSQLVEFREGSRTDPIMTEMIKGMSDDDLRAAAAWITTLSRPPAPKRPDNPTRMKHGSALAAQHRCNICHGPQYLGSEQMPPLRNQREDYLLKSLRAFKAEKRIGDRAAMVEVLLPLKDADFVDLAHYLAHMRE